MKKSKLTLIGIAVISTFFLTSSAMAWRGGMGRGMGGGGLGPDGCMFFSVPNLTEEQSAKLTDLQKSFIMDTSKLRSDLAVKRIELNQLLRQSQPKTEEVMAKQEELSDLQSQLQKKCLSKQLDMRKILTDEQLSQIPPSGYGPGANNPPGWRRGYGPSQGQSFGPGGGGYWGNMRGRRPCWW